MVIYDLYWPYRYLWTMLPQKAVLMFVVYAPIGDHVEVHGPILGVYVNVSGSC